MAKFITDCIARAIMTLPYATITEDDLHLRDIRRDIESEDKTKVAAAVAKFCELVDSQIQIHTSCGNYLKAGVLYNFKNGFEDHYYATVSAAQRRSRKAR